MDSRQKLAGMTSHRAATRDHRVLQVVISGTSILTTAYAGAIEVAISSTARITKTYYSTGSQLIAMRVATSTAQSTLYFLSSDHLGSSSLTTNASGNFVARQLYDAWGNIRSGGGLPTDIGYVGKRLDTTGLMFYGARYFSPMVGRFVSPDWVVPDPTRSRDLNRYAYAANSPLSFIDPNGHQTRPACGGVICSTGTTGPYVGSSNGSGVTTDVAIPQGQPLTVATTNSKSDIYTIGIDFNARSDDGFLAIYRVPGYAQRRQEVVILSLQARGGGVSGSIENRDVTIYPLLGNDPIKKFNEIAVSGGAGASLPILGKFEVGGEVSYGGDGGSMLPSVTGDVAGLQVSLRPNQMMAGYVSPIFGGGVREGVQWQFEHDVWALTDRYTIDKIGGFNTFGRKYVDPEAIFVSQTSQYHVGPISGFNWLEMILGKIYGIPLEEKDQ